MSVKSEIGCDDMASIVGMLTTWQKHPIFYLTLSLCVHVIFAGNSSDVQVNISADCNSVILLCEEGKMIVVRRATFSPMKDTIEDCRKHVHPFINNHDMLVAVVSKCNGVREGFCKFIMKEDIPGSEGWGSGRIQVEYQCVTEVYAYCGGRVDVRAPGYLASPGYPAYYLGGRECLWSLVAEEGQRVKLRVVDLSLRRTILPCQDYVRVLEGNSTFEQMCGTKHGSFELLSKFNNLEVRMQTAPSSQQIYPKRGLLIYYEPVGCPFPPPISEGQVILHNQTHGVLQCNPGHLFKSSLSSTLEVTCRSWNWHPPLEHCMSMKFLIEYGDNSVVAALTAKWQYLRQQEQRTSSSSSFELVVTFMIGGLLLLCLSICGVYLLREGKLRNKQQLIVQDRSVETGDTEQEYNERY